MTGSCKSSAILDCLQLLSTPLCSLGVLEKCMVQIKIMRFEQIKRDCFISAITREPCSLGWGTFLRCRNPKRSFASLMLATLEEALEIHYQLQGQRIKV